MIEHFVNNAAQFVQTNVWLAFVSVFLGGVISAANPCVIASIPLIMGFIGGEQNDTTRGLKSAFLVSLTFVGGLAVMFTIMGTIAALAGRLFGDVSAYWKYIIAAVCLFMGLHLIGVFKFAIPAPKFIKPKTGIFLTAFLFGLMFGIVSAPCAAPILVVILTFIASKGNIAYGVSLLLTYSLGHGILIIVAGTSVGIAKSMVQSKGLRKANYWIQKVAGALIIAVGGYILLE